MDASCEIQGNIHVFRLINNMCPGFWVHITNAGFSLYKNPRFQGLEFGGRPHKWC